VGQFLPIGAATQAFAQGGPLEKKDLRSASFPSRAQRPSSWPLPWASMRSRASTSRW
jgi:hypothetical protein